MLLQFTVSVINVYPLSYLYLCILLLITNEP